MLGRAWCVGTAGIDRVHLKIIYFIQWNKVNAKMVFKNTTQARKEQDEEEKTTATRL